MEDQKDLDAAEVTALRPGKTTTTMKRRRRVLHSLRSADWWVWEILSLVVSAGALVTIVLLLSSLNDKPQPSWASAGTHCFSEPGIADIVCRQSGISVNSVVSWLGTLARLCLLVPLANCLGQLKWTWFGSRERSLADLDAFDAASRGLTGSLQLIWKLKARYIATLGATGIILSVAFDPFVQNLVGYYTKDVVDPSGLAFVANTSVYHNEGWSTNNYRYVNAALRSNVLNAFHSSHSRHTWAEPRHVCSTGHCTWRPTASIGMCTTCEDITATVTRTCEDVGEGDGDFTPTLRYCNLSLPGLEDALSYDSSFGFLIGQMFMIRAISGGKSDLTPRSVVSVYLDIDIQDTMDGKGWTGDDPPYVASNCTLEPCIKSIKSNYDQSAEPPYREETLKTWFQDPSPGVFRLAGEIQAPVEPEYGANGENFTIESRTFQSIFYYIDTFSGVYEKRSDLDNTFANDYGSESADPDEIIFALWNGNYTECEYPDNRVSCGLDLATKAMSKTMRDFPYDVNGTQGAAGDAYSPIVHIHVTWIWITLPACTWVLALVTFLATAWKSSQRTEHVWRNSTLPISFMILEDEVVEQGERNTDVKALQHRATAIKGRVQIEDGQVKFAT